MHRLGRHAHVMRMWLNAMVSDWARRMSAWVQGKHVDDAV